MSTAPAVSLVVGRAQGSVVVTVDGDLDHDGCRLLERLLTDLIDGQGNAVVSVDLVRATVGPEATSVFADAMQRAGRQGTRFVVEPPAHRPW